MSALSSPAGIVHQEAVMGTVVTFDVVTSAPTHDVQTAIGRAVDWLHLVDDTFSTFKPESEVCRFDRGELEIGAGGDDLRRVLALCHRFHQETGGYFDAWAGGRFDPSGVVKGWSIERASHLLSRAGMSNHIVDGGGDVVFRGQPARGLPWRVGVRHPLRPEAYCAVLSLRDGAVATSGTYERGPHVVNPLTGRPATDLVSVTVVGPELYVADAYATAALAMGEKAPAWLDALSGYEALVVAPDGRGWSTRGWAGVALPLPGGGDGLPVSASG
jgi:FAD:protein FMN transferase